MKDKMKLYKKQIIILSIILVIAIAIIIFILGRSYALVSGERVEEDSELTYYLTVTYDGVDVNGIESNDSTRTEVKSDIITVEDTIPEDLIFQGFEGQVDQEIDAVRRDDPTHGCSGYVVGGYNGLSYDATTRTVSFQVKALQAGCQLTVGIKTKTPLLNGRDRLDFYNTAFARESKQTASSNTFHSFMGEEPTTKYKVTYEYSGTVPKEAPTLPTEKEYAADSEVTIETIPEIEGYSFSGFTCNTTTTGNKFTITSDVTCTGSFTEKTVTKYSVSYIIDGTSPSNYVTPDVEEYEEGSLVKVDNALTNNSTFNGYRFLGWETTDVTLGTDGDFEMPNKNVTFTGKFEEITYKVSYQFYDTVLPPNSENYLPATKSYKPGATVTLDTVSDVTGYVFLGWYKENEFKMPEEDVIVYGEWKVQTGTFEPTITKEIVNQKPYYQAGNIVEFKTTVTNTAAFEIKDVIVKEEKIDAVYQPGTNYTVLSDHVASIPTIAAGESVNLDSEYKVTATDKNVLENAAAIKGALADNNYELADKDYLAEVTFNIQSKLTICTEITGVSVPNTFQYNITGTAKQYETWLTLEKGECKSIYVDPSTYKIQEIVPQEYELTSVEGDLTSNNSNLVIEQGTDYDIKYNNTFRRKGFLHSFGRVVNQIIGRSQK